MRYLSKKGLKDETAINGYLVIGVPGVVGFPVRRMVLFDPL